MRTEPYTPCCRHVASTPQGSRRTPSSSITTESARPGRALLRYSVVAEVEALVLGGSPAGAAVRHVAGTDRVDLDGRPGAHQRAYPATLARGLLLLLSALGGPLPTIATFHILS